MTVVVMPPAAGTSSRIVSLDGLRGIAALFVVVHHLPGMFGFVVPKAHLAVDFFFILSGWVMAHSYEARIAGGLSLRAFSVQRFARLYPLYAVTMLLGLALVSIKVYLGVSQANLVCAAPNALLLPCLAKSASAFPFNSPSWSIFSEVAVNFLWFFIVRAGCYALRWKIAIHVALLLTAWSYVFIKGSYLAGFETSALHEGPLRGALGFAAGLLLYECRRKFWVAAYFGALALLLLAAVRIGDIKGDFTAELLLTTAAFPFLVWLAARLRPALLEGRLSAWLGDISYAVYLLHVPLGMLLQKKLAVLSLLPEPWSWITKATLYSTLLLSLGTLSFHKLEHPARRWVLRRFQPARAAETAANTAYQR